MPAGYRAADWIQRIEEIREAYGWPAAMCLNRARTRLRGTAQTWHDAVAMTLTTWHEFAAALIRAFPVASNAASTHSMLAMKRKKNTETYAAYAYEMLSIGRKGRVCESDVVDYVLRGVDEATSNALSALPINTIEDFLMAVSRYEQRRRTTRSEPKRTTLEANAMNPPTAKAETTMRKCYNCGEAGHLSKNCPTKKQGLKCFRCQKFGHRATECRNTADNRVNFIKEVVVNGKECKALFDTGSGRNLITTEFSNELNSTSRHEENVLQGFGGIPTRCNTVVDVKMEFDQHMFQEPAIVVPPKTLDVDMLLGREFLSKVIYKSTFGNIQIIDESKIDAGTTTSDAEDDVIVSKQNDVASDIQDNKDEIAVKTRDDKDDALQPRREHASAIVDSMNDELPNMKINEKADDVDEAKSNDNDEDAQSTSASRDSRVVEIDGDVRADDTSINDILLIAAEDDDAGISNNLPSKYADAVREMISTYKPAARTNTKVQTKIILNDTEPVALPPRRLAPAEKAEVNRQIEQWLKDGVIRKSSSEYSSPVVLVRKKDGSARMCVDYRLLNKKAVRDRYPLPLIEDQLDRLNGASVFSTIDLKNGFFHVPVEENSRRYTAFVTPSGQYEFMKTPFGFCNSASSFQRYINEVFEPLIAEGVIAAYMDDVIILAKDEQEGLTRLRRVLSRAAECGLVINWTKCQFLTRRISFLGYEIEAGMIRPSREKTRAITEFPKPMNVKQLQRFLGMTSYFRKFIPKYAKVAKPLTNLLKKETAFEFGTTQENAFDELKRALTSKPILGVYNPNAIITELHTDACRDGLAAVLLQRDENDKKLHPIHYFSKVTTPAQRNYTSYELEILAVVEALKKFRVYLLGIEFTVVTDCSAFQMTMQKRELSTRIARWALLIEDFKCKVIHRSGANMKHADALSRAPLMLIEDSWLRRIQKAMKDDDAAKDIIARLNQGRNEGFETSNELLYRLKDGDDKLYVPKKLQSGLIKTIHEVGHFGIKKTCEAFNKDYWIPKLVNKVKDVIGNCIPCILAEAKRGKQEGLLNPINKNGGPLDTLHIDHLGPMPSSSKRYQHLLVVIDGFTKFTWIFPTKSTTTAETINKIKTIQKTFGNPRRYVTDRGTAFSSREFAKFCSDESIAHRMITTGVPRGNGQVERIHQVIKAALTKMADPIPESWYKHVPAVQRHINASYQRSIDTTPFELLTGISMRNKEDVMLREAIQEEIRHIHRETRDQLREDAKEQIRKVQNENRRTYNRKRKLARKYEVGDFVAIKRTQFVPGGKFKTPFLGPYEVVAVKPADRYDVRRASDSEGPRLTSASADHMKPWSNEAPQANEEDRKEDEPAIFTEDEDTAAAINDPHHHEEDANPKEPVTPEPMVEVDHLSGTAGLWARHPYTPPRTRRALDRKKATTSNNGE